MLSVRVREEKSYVAAGIAQWALREIGAMADVCNHVFGARNR